MPADVPSSLTQALRHRIALGSLRAPLWLAWAASLLAVAALTHWASAAAAARGLAEPRSTPAAFATPDASAQPAPEASAGDAAALPGSAPSLVASARGGDLESLKRLETAVAEERGADEILALAAGHEVLLRRDVEHLGQQLARDPSLAQDPSVLALLHGHALDPRAAPVAVGVIARLPGVVGADMLYDVWKASVHAAPRALAQGFLASRQLARDKASPALDAALRLELETRCERLAQLLPAVEKSADQRARRRLDELGKRTGCGKNDADDCFACLRDDDRLERARGAALERKPPRPWIIRRR